MFMRNKKETLMKKIRSAEEAIAYASPNKAAKLAEKIAYWKAVVFD